jgi:hypothetical protein
MILTCRDRDTFTSSGIVNCQLTALTADSILNGDLKPDRGWDVYERLFNGRCIDDGNGNGGGGGVINPSGK